MNAKRATVYKPYRGIVPPLITPLTEEETLDMEALGNLIEHCIQAGVHGVFTMGSSGEAMEVTTEVWLETIKETLRIVGGRIPVFCGVIDSCTSRVLERIRMAEDVGAEHIVVVPPFYLNVSSQDEIIRHFEMICSKTTLKVVAYNIPQMTHANILPETIKKIAEFDNLVMYKDSSSDWEQFQRNLFLLEGSKISLFNGAEELCAPAMIFGADGCVPGLANFFPELFVSMYDAALREDIQEVYRYQKQIWELRKVLFVGSSWMSAMKYLGFLYGYGIGKVSTPVEPLTLKEKEELYCMLLKAHDQYGVKIPELQRGIIV